MVRTSRLHDLQTLGRGCHRRCLNYHPNQSLHSATSAVGTEIEVLLAVDVAISVVTFAVAEAGAEGEESAEAATGDTTAADTAAAIAVVMEATAAVMADNAVTGHQHRLPTLTRPQDLHNNLSPRNPPRTHICRHHLMALMPTRFPLLRLHSGLRPARHMCRRLRCRTSTDRAQASHQSRQCRPTTSTTKPGRRTRRTHTRTASMGIPHRLRSSSSRPRPDIGRRYLRQRGLRLACLPLLLPAHTSTRRFLEERHRARYRRRRCLQRLSSRTGDSLTAVMGRASELLAK